MDIKKKINSVRPRKEFGQNFLKNKNILEKEAAYAELCEKDTVLEIGPGIGNLTEILCRKAKKVFAIEKDSQFKKNLIELEKRFPNLEVIFGDATTVELPKANKVISNLPFNVSLPIIFRIVEMGFDLSVLICQERLAKRICANPGEPGYSRLSVSIQRLADVEILKKIPGKAYEPPVDVNTSIIRMRNTGPKFEIPDEKFFRKTLEYLFLKRERKISEVLDEIGCKKTPVKDDIIESMSPKDLGKVSLYLYSKNFKIPDVTAEQKRKAQKN